MATTVKDPVCGMDIDPTTAASKSEYKGQTYYSHLVAEQAIPVSLYLSPNIENEEVKNFFISYFKRDYPTLVLVTKDIDLKY